MTGRQADLYWCDIVRENKLLTIGAVEEKIELVLRVAFGNPFERLKSEPTDAFQFILE
jgi:hypothetical protein